MKGISKLVNDVEEHDLNVNRKIQHETSNDLFKQSLMGFMTRQAHSIEQVDENESLIDEANSKAISRLVELIEEDGMQVKDLMDFSDMLSRQKSTLSRDKTNRLHALFDILKPTKESSNPLLNNDRTEDNSESNIINQLGTKELQVLLKLTQAMANNSSKDD